MAVQKPTTDAPPPDAAVRVPAPAVDTPPPHNEEDFEKARNQVAPGDSVVIRGEDRSIHAPGRESAAKRAENLGLGSANRWTSQLLNRR